jgi:secretion/DNA translocation related TadE-like protein
MRVPRLESDRGAGTIFVLALGLLLIAAGVAGAAIGSVRVGRHEARTAADLGALAGAVRVIDGPPAACARAARLVAANDAILTSCVVYELEIVIYVEVEVTPLPGFTRRAQAGARAGPVYSVGGEGVRPGR